MYFVRRFSILVLCGVLFLTGCSFSIKPGLSRYDAQFLGVFDTVTSIVGYTRNEEEFTAYAKQLQEGLEEYHQLYDIYHEYEGMNNLKTINDMAGIQPVVVDEKIIDMLEEAVEMYELTDGRVNVAMGSVLSVWHDYRDAGIDDPENAKLPTEEELAEAARHMDITKLKIDRQASTVYLEDPDMSLDVGSIGKGYATEMVCRKLEESGLTSALVSVGGNIRGIGAKNGKEVWKVGIQNPDTSSSQTYLYKAGIEGQSLVTSGTYQRYYTVDGVQYHHIIHPDLLKPWNEYASVSVICPDSGKADALSTALFNMSLDEGMDLAATLEDVEVMWLKPDGSEYHTEGFQKYLIK